jgi:hypothetical protein
VGVFPDTFGWGFRVVTPDVTRSSSYGYGFPTEADARRAARKAARFCDRLERDRVDGVVSKRTDRVLEHGVRVCEKCGKPHDLVAMTRRGRRFGQTWASPDCGAYYPESWEALARRLMAEAAA